MKTILSSNGHRCLARFGIFSITVALIAGMVGCDATSPGLKIWDWYDLYAIRDSLGAACLLMCNLDSTTAGYKELASETANEGKGWLPIGTQDKPFTGTLDGQGYEISDLFVGRLDEYHVGLFGYVGENGTVENVGVADAYVVGEWCVGGLVGINLGSVSNCYCSGSVSGNYSVGGLVGENEKGSVSNSYSTGSVTGDVGVGGLAGWNQGTVSDSYSTGNVTGEWLVGGLVGQNQGTVSKSYSTGGVTGDVNVGGLVGVGGGTVSNSFWDKETSGQTSSAGGTGKTTVQMKNIDTFSAWDITAVISGQTNPTYTWNIVDEQTYPFLSWQS